MGESSPHAAPSLMQTLSEETPLYTVRRPTTIVPEIHQHGPPKPDIHQNISRHDIQRLLPKTSASEISMRSLCREGIVEEPSTSTCESNIVEESGEAQDRTKKTNVKQDDSERSNRSNKREKDQNRDRTRHRQRNNHNRESSK